MHIHRFVGMLSGPVATRSAMLALLLGWVGSAWALPPLHSSPIQVSDDGAYAWVVNPDSDSVGKIDTASNTLVGEYPVGDNPRTLSLGGGSVYVVNQGSEDLTPKPNPETVMRLDEGSGAVQATFTLPFGCAPYGVVYNETLGAVYVSCERNQTVVILDANLGSVTASVSLGWADPRGLALTSDRSKLYVAHFLTRSPNNDAHVTEIDVAAVPPAITRVFSIPPDETTCETINSGKGVLNLLTGIHLIPDGAPGNVANQLWVGGVMQNNLTKGMFRNDERFGGNADPLLCVGGANNSRRCKTDADCKPGGTCQASFIAVSRNLYKVSFHDVTRFAISKIDLTTGEVIGKIDVDEANHGSDIVFNGSGQVAYVVDQFFNSLHIFNTARGQDGDPTTLFAGPSRFGPGGTDPSQECTGGSFLTGSELPFILPPQVQLVPIAADPVMVDGSGSANTGNEYDVTTGQMRPVPDSVGTTPHGIALSPDGSKAYVANFLSRNVTVVKTDGFFCPNGNSCQSRVDCNGCAPRVIAVVPSISNPDPIPAPLLDGKILFHTAARDASVPNGIGLGAPAPRFNFDDPDVLEPVGAVVSTSHDASYVACISCHPEGGMDGRSWDFSQFGASIRNTMDLRGRASMAPGTCTAPAGLSCTTDSECANDGIGTCDNDPSVVCELDIQCGMCAGDSPTPGMTCIADKQCGGVCSNDNQVTCTTAGDCGGVCREDGVTPCADDGDCDFGCKITNTCNFFSCATQTCSAAKCVADPQNTPRNVGVGSKFLNPMMTVHWNGDRDEVEDFEFTYRSLMGGGDCDGVEDLPDKCIGALVMRSNVAKPQEISPDLGPSNRGLSPRLDHMADYVYSLTSFVRNPNLAGGPSPDAIEGGKIFFHTLSRCAECHNGPSPSNQHFSDKRPDPNYPLGLQGRPENPNPYVRHNVATFNAFDLVDPLEVADDIGQYQNGVIPIPGSRGELLEYVTPTLVDVWNTAPYNHDGTFDSLLHGIVPCNTAVDPCESSDSGKNLNDQHGTTSNLTPRQLRQLAAFLLAPHNASPGVVTQASPFTKLRSVTIKFGSNPSADDDKLTLKATFRVPPSASFDLSQVVSAPLTISLADVDTEMFERTIPGGSMQVNSAGTTAIFRDRTLQIAPGIGQVKIRLLNPTTRDYEITVKGKDLDLSLLDKRHISIGLETSTASFVKTRTFDQPNPRILKVAER